MLSIVDKNFLKQLVETRNKNIYGRIILLTKDELPIEKIEGKITQGFINIDGDSAIRRTCSLTLVGQEQQQQLDLIQMALENKFKLEIGIENNINPNFPQIIWFKQGIYIFISLNINKQTNNFTISLNGKDKGCLINGEFGGTINVSTDFGQLEEYITLESGEIVRKLTKIPIIDIIKNIIHLQAQEPLSNIIINDIDSYGLELLEYKGEKPLYMPRIASGEKEGEVINITTNGKQEYYTESGAEITLDSITNYYDRTNMTLTPPDIVYSSPNGTTQYNIIKIQNGETAGYRRTDLTYPGELIGNVGESLVSILDKIKNMFGDFEYFYDIDGRFVFQKKKTYINTSWNNLQKSNNSVYAENAKYSSEVVYSFQDEEFFSAITQNPNIGNIKNDFSIWGKRKGVDGAELPVHMRYAIDFKPTYYKTLDGEIFTSEQYDWRELIYQMALDYFKYNHIKSDFTQLIAAANPDHYPTGITGYENYYTDLQGFWRELYNPAAVGMQGDYEKIGEIEEKNFSTNTYYTYSEETKQYEEAKQYDKEAEYYIISNWKTLDIFKGATTGRFSVTTGFSEQVEKFPELLNFWFDFLEAKGSDIEKYAVQNIGARSKAVNNDNIKAIYYQEIPNIIFFNPKKEIINKSELTGYTFVQTNTALENCFSISAQGLSAKDELDSLLYQHTFANDNITLTCVPIYYLEPNNKIEIKNEKYIVNKISIPLQYNGMSSITVTKEIDRIY